MAAGTPLPCKRGVSLPHLRGPHGLEQWPQGPELRELQPAWNPGGAGGLIVETAQIGFHIKEKQTEEGSSSSL